MNKKTDDLFKILENGENIGEYFSENIEEIYREIGAFRLNTHFQLRIAPAMYFGTRHLSFYNMLEKDGAGNPIQQKQEMKTAYISSALDLIFAAQRFNNHRPYIMAGINPMMKLNIHGRFPIDD